MKISKMIAYMERMFLACVGRKTTVHEIPEDSKKLGYTNGSGDVYINFSHPIMDGLSEKQTMLFTLGVFVHEMLHQIYTDFSLLDEAINNMATRDEKAVVRLMVNLIEDPTIEYRAPLKLGGILLKALRYMIRVIYIGASDISDESAFSELCSALIQFGDMGLIKGRFTSKEAEECFREIAPEFNTMIKSGTPKERIDAAVRWTELTRPLWKKEDDPEKAANKIAEENGVSDYEGPDAEETEQESDSSAPAPGKTPEAERRDNFSSELEEGEEDNSESTRKAENSPKSGSGNSDDKDNDSEPKDGKEGNKKADTKNSEESKDKAGEGSKGTPEEASKDADSDPDGTSDDDQNVDSDHIGSVYKDKDTANQIVFDELEVTDEDIEKAVEEIEKSHERGSDESSKKAFIQNLDVPVTSKYFTRATCVNHRLMTNSYTAKSEYEKIVRRNQRQISDLTKQLKKYFSQDDDEMIRSMSGEYNVSRAIKGTSMRMFDKRRTSEHMDDLAVFILIDNSGSMAQGNKIGTAQESAVIFAEVFAKLKIPLYVMGFTADFDGYQVVHDHFITWSNTLAERYSLANMRPKGCNFDGYSIRYAGKWISRKHADHKILFVISDGLPNCSRYLNPRTGLADTADAIRTVKKDASVVGIGLGSDCNSMKFSEMYQGDFLHVKDISKLTEKLVEVLKRLVRHY